MCTYQLENVTPLHREDIYNTDDPIGMITRFNTYQKMYTMQQTRSIGGGGWF
jgi:hypothetical protein